MADDVAITAGAGTTIAADEKTINATAVKVQRVNLALGKDGTYIGDLSGRTVDGDANASALMNDPRQNLQRLTQTSAGLTTATTAYTAGDQLGNQMTFTGAARATGGVGRIIAAALKDNNKVIGGVDLRLFRASVTPAADNAAESFSDGDMDSWVGTIQMPYADSLALNAVSYAGSLNIPYDCAATSLFVTMVTRSNNAIFGATNDLRLTLFVVLD